MDEALWTCHNCGRALQPNHRRRFCCSKCRQEWHYRQRKALELIGRRQGTPQGESK